MAAFLHPSALVESDQIGDRTNVWAYAHIMPEATIGEQCNVGDHVFIESGAIVGSRVTIKNCVCVWKGVLIEDDCFIGPNVMFTNDLLPRSPRMVEAHARYQSESNWLVSTAVRKGSSIGANSTIVPGITLGEYSMIGAGSVVTHDVAPHSLVLGNPARHVGFVCRCGQKTSAAHTPCARCETD